MGNSQNKKPDSIELGFDSPQLLATGADLKNAFCLAKGRSAFLSQDFGNLENADVHNAFEQAVAQLKKQLDIEPEIVACDLHPDYFSTRYAKSPRFTLHASRFTEVQHHHAHIASCMADNNLPDEKVIGIALDGTGFGTDGTIWGGEILIADYCGFERAAHFKPVPLPGGDAAAREPWRMAVAYLQTMDHGPWTIDQESKALHASRFTLHEFIGRDKIELILQIIEKNINCPMTSSCGRLFDAVAALIGLCMYNTFEGEAPIKLERIADKDEDGYYNFTIETMDHGPWTMDQNPFQIVFDEMFAGIIEDLKKGNLNKIISAKFHNTLVNALVEVSHRIKKRSMVNGQLSMVCISGGCFQNTYLTTRLKKRLEDEGFKVYTHSRVPPNDRGIALGQAAIAAHLTRNKSCA